MEIGFFWWNKWTKNWEYSQIIKNQDQGLPAQICDSPCFEFVFKVVPSFLWWARRSGNLSMCYLSLCLFYAVTYPKFWHHWKGFAVLRYRCAMLVKGWNPICHLPASIWQGWPDYPGVVEKVWHFCTGWEAEITGFYQPVFAKLGKMGSKPPLFLGQLIFSEYFFI